jgi:spore germination cell wall hydrolase CwlJ-like protein
MLLETAFLCLALNTYHEAKNQSMVGQIAVAEVVMNRVADRRYPNTVCEVVKQGPKYKGSDIPVRHKCQFSWFCDGKSDLPKNEKAWKKAQDYAYLVLYNRIAIDITEGATHYHADYVEPAWAKTKTKTIEIEDHIFYRWEVQE